MDLISAQTDLALRAAGEQLSGRLGQRVGSLREELLSARGSRGSLHRLSRTRTSTPTPVQPCWRASARSLLTLDALLATAGQGRILREGVRTVIYGEPNVGKSSLLNALLGHDRAIVSARPRHHARHHRGICQRARTAVAAHRHGGPARHRRPVGSGRVSNAPAIPSPARTSRCTSSMPVFPPPDTMERSSFSRRIGRNPGAQQGGPRSASLVLANAFRWRGCRAGVLRGIGDGTWSACRQAIYDRITGGQVAWNPSTAAINARHQDCLQRAHLASAGCGRSVERGPLAGVRGAGPSLGARRGGRDDRRRGHRGNSRAGFSRRSASANKPVRLKPGSACVKGGVCFRP